MIEMTIAEIIAIMLSMNAMIGVCFLILYFKIDNNEFKLNIIKVNVDEIKRKVENEQ